MRAIPEVAALALEQVTTAARSHVATAPPDARLLRQARLTVSFHPDRAAASGLTAAQALAEDGSYRTQYETGISSGGLDDVLGGARTRWEHHMFAGAYDDAPAQLRPRYGGLDVLPYPDGACPRFGSTHLRLLPTVLRRATFCFGDSVTEPPLMSTWSHVALVLAAAQAAGAPEVRGETSAGPARLDRYIEAQVHGGIELGPDVEAIVTDPSYRGTEVEAHLQRACEASRTRLEWHAGYALAADEIDPAFRGEGAASLARRIGRDLAPGEPLTAAVLGRADAAVLADPGAWAQWGGVREVRQFLKYLWHHLVAFGART